MKAKINILIIVSILSIIVLSSIQYSLIKNTFNLQRDLFIREVKKDLKFIEQNERSDTWDESYLKAFKKQAIAYRNGYVSKEKLLSNFKNFRDSINIEFQKYFDKGLSKKNLLFPVEFQQELTSVILLDKVNDTIIHSKSAPLLLFGKALNTETRFGFNTGKWETTSSTKQEKDSVLKVDENIGFIIKSESYIDVPNWQTEVFKRMFWMLLASVLSILSVIALFSYAIYSLIKQKKTADIKTDFVNNITHELKTPLATLSIATKTLQQENIQSNKEVLKGTINTIDRQRIRLQNLIDQVVNNSLGFEEIQLKKEEVNPKKWLKNLINDYKIQQNEVEILADFPVKNINLSIDTFHFNTTILNLLDNAIKYGSSKILISSDVIQDQFQLKIKDNGKGIEPKHQQKIFDKFYRVENANIHNVKGLGLGLYYVNQIVKAHNGTVNLQSELEKGTTITIKIPVK